MMQGKAEREECPACKSAKTPPIFEIWDDRYGFTGQFPLCRCERCGTFYLGNCPDVDSLSELYEKYYPAFSLETFNLPDSFLRSLTRFFLNTAPLGTGMSFNRLSVLDVGCGGGESAIVVRRGGGRWTGLEIDPKRTQALKNQGLDCLCGSPEALCDQYSEAFDVILASQVLEHSFSPRKFLLACQEMLKPGGSLVLSTPNAESRFQQKTGKNWINWHCPYHLAIFSPLGIKLISQDTGFSLVRCTSCTPATWRAYQRIYQCPPMGIRGAWYAENLSLSSKITAGFLARFGDLILGNGDMLVAVLKKRDKND